MQLYHDHNFSFFLIFFYTIFFSSVLPPTLNKYFFWWSSFSGGHPRLIVGKHFKSPLGYNSVLTKLYIPWHDKGRIIDLITPTSHYVPIHPAVQSCCVSVMAAVQHLTYTFFAFSHQSRSTEADTSLIMLWSEFPKLSRAFEYKACWMFHWKLVKQPRYYIFWKHTSSEYYVLSVWK